MYKQNSEKVKDVYIAAKERYRQLGIDTDLVLKELDKIPVSINCWQGDDLAGFEKNADKVTSGGIMSTGNYPGRAKNGEELRSDLEKAMTLIPGSHKVNLHAIYAETEGEVLDRLELETKHFQKWIDWAKGNNICLDFNPSVFAHDKASSGFTLSSDDSEIRQYWIEHVKRSREIAEYIGKEQGSVCVNNLWIPDGSKDVTVSKYKHRMHLKNSLDEIYSKIADPKYLLDSVESKLFGLGSESFVTGSLEFYLSYVMENKDISLCLDMGHFHPTESVADKISSVLTFKDNLLLHVSRPVRWDSDHVVTFNDELIMLMNEVKRAAAFNKTYFAVDFFDGSINRITAWVVGVRNTLKALLFALLEPTELMLEAEMSGNLGNRLALLEECKTLPFGAVWDKYCIEKGVPISTSWISEVMKYEKEILSKRGV